MEIKLTLALQKKTKNKSVYGTTNGQVIQGVYIDTDALPSPTPESLEVTIQA